MPAAFDGSNCCAGVCLGTGKLPSHGRVKPAVSNTEQASSYLRDAMLTRSLLRHRGWLPVTRLCYAWTAKTILKPFRPSSSTSTLVFDPLRRIPIPSVTSSAGAQNTRGWENWLFSTEIAVYLGNGTRQANGYYEKLIESHGCRIEWYYFR